jgi:hypothetical protein
VTGPISRHRPLGSLQEAAGWPGADRGTVVTLATTLVAARADADGSRYFQDPSEQNPADATALALAGFLQVRAGHDVDAALTKLDQAVTMEPACPSTSAAWPWRSWTRCATSASWLPGSSSRVTRR